LAEIAVELERALADRRESGAAGRTSPRVIARGDGWTVADVVCTCGPQDRRYEEQHARSTVAIVLAGSFQYRGDLGYGLMTPGSLMLGNHGGCFECGHDHGEGDRCVSFWYDPDYFERLATDAGVRRNCRRFAVPHVPPLRSSAALVASAALGAVGSCQVPWDELCIRLAATALRLASGAAIASDRLPLNAEARVTQVVRTIDRYPSARLTLAALSRVAGLSPYHFLRTFEVVTGVTPHQYVLRARLRQAAFRLVTGSANVLDVALDCGFGDVSNFNRAFRAEFGLTPVAYRRRERPVRAVSRPLAAYIMAAARQKTR
jgi:AraC family transcriptional regulator